MPIYEYQCQACQEILEVQQALAEKPLTVCPACSGDLKKLISQSSFQLKGGGWYSDGYSGGASPCKAATTEAAPAACPASESCGCKCG